MTALDKFKELKDIAIKKCMQYMEEGRDKDEAIELIKPEIDNMLQFVKDNQKELYDHQQEQHFKVYCNHPKWVDDL